MKQNLKIIFMGTPEFAVPSLDILVQNKYEVAAVITAPDKPSGRGLKLTMSPVKEYALSQNIPVLQPTNLKDPDFIKELAAYQANLQIVVAFRMLPEAVWNMPELGTFNLHASLLPQYRGAAPINWAIINGEKETGVSTFFLKHEIDTGDLLFQEKETINETDNVEDLYERLMSKGSGLVLKTVQAIENKDYHPIPQVYSGKIKTAPKIFKEMCEIDWGKPAEDVYNFIRGLSPYPGAWTMLNGKFCKIYRAEKIGNNMDKNLSLGQFYTDNAHIYFKCLDGILAIDEIQMEGKKRMPVQEFLKGNKI